MTNLLIWISNKCLVERFFSIVADVDVININVGYVFAKNQFCLKLMIDKLYRDTDVLE